MASPMEQPKCDICNIVKLKKMTSMWRKCNRDGGGRNVGMSRRRLVIKAELLNHPIFRQLLDQAHEQCSHQRDGPLALPCDQSLFREVVGLIECGMNADPLLVSCRRKGWRDLAPPICGSIYEKICVLEEASIA